MVGEGAARASFVALFVFTAGLAIQGCAGPRTGSNVNGASAPVVGDFTLSDLSGKRVRLGQYGGKVVYLSFWATWCEPCRVELGLLQKTWKRLRGKGFELISICADPPDRLGLVRQQVKRDGYEFPVLLDADSELLDRFNPTMDLPFGLLLDRNGRIRHMQHGFRLGDEKSIEAKIEQLLAETVE